jgi:hypothetical protein
VAEVVISVGIPVNQDSSAAKIATELAEHRQRLLAVAGLSIVYAIAFVIYLWRLYVWDVKTKFAGGEMTICRRNANLRPLGTGPAFISARRTRPTRSTERRASGRDCVCGDRRGGAGCGGRSGSGRSKGGEK